VVEEFKEKFSSCAHEDTVKKKTARRKRNKAKRRRVDAGTNSETEFVCDPCSRLRGNVLAKPKDMTTAEAVASGKRAAAATKQLKDNPKVRGLKTKVKKVIEEESFKDVTVFFKYCGEDWDLVKRLACDPAHTFCNLAKDCLALLNNSGNMSLKKKYLEYEHKHGRLNSVMNCKRKKTGDEEENYVGASWHISKKYKNILGQLLFTLKVPEDWPMLLNYFCDDYEKIKLAQGLAFLGDIGCYMIGLTDLPLDVKELFIGLFRVTGRFLHKDATAVAGAKLKALQKEMVR
jgi:hypothetical protein